MHINLQELESANHNHDSCNYNCIFITFFSKMILEFIFQAEVVITAGKMANMWFA